MAGLTSHLWLSIVLTYMGVCVTGKAGLLMTNEEGELKSVCYREGKVLLKRKHWHQSIIANWIRLFKKLITTQFPYPTPNPPLSSYHPPSKTSPKSQQNCRKNKAQWQSHKTINNTFQVGGTWIVMTSSDSYGTSFPLYFIERQKSPIHHCPSTNMQKKLHRDYKVCVAVVIFTRWIRLMPL